MQTTLNAQPTATRSPLNSFGTAMTATRSPLNSRSVRRTCGKKEAHGRHPEGVPHQRSWATPSGSVLPTFAGSAGRSDLRLLRGDVFNVLPSDLRLLRGDVFNVLPSDLRLLRGDGHSRASSPTRSLSPSCAAAPLPCRQLRGGSNWGA